MDPEMEQLLQEQETFLRSKQAPAAKVVRRRPEGNGKPAVSAFKAAASGAEGAGGVKKPIMDMPSVVGAVVERQERGERAASRPSRETRIHRERQTASQCPSFPILGAQIACLLGVALTPGIVPPAAAVCQPMQVSTRGSISGFPVAKPRPRAAAEPRSTVVRTYV
jgi:hypothetical protein